MKRACYFFPHFPAPFQGLPLEDGYIGPINQDRLGTDIMMSFMMCFFTTPIN